ncbi:tyrosine-type recombinase/integrase [Mesorhizobium sp. 43Arga]
MPLTIYKRGRIWWLTGSVNNRDGKSRVHESTGTADEAEATRIRIRREADAAEAIHADPKSLYTFAAAVNLYLDAGKDERFIGPLLEHFADTRISAMTGDSVRAAAKALYPGAAYTTWNRQVVTPAKAIINHAANAGKCYAITIKGFSKRDRDARRPDTPPRQAVDRSYIDAFRAHCEVPRIGTLMLLLFQTGARIGDAVRLEWRDVDLDEKRVTFREMKNGDDGTADLTDELALELRSMRAAAVVVAGGGSIDADRVFGFSHRFGLYRVIRSTCQKAGIPYLGTHQPGRHSFATEMIVRHGVDVATTAAKGRWKSKQLLISTYVHEERDRTVIDRVFGGAREQS